MTHQFIKRSGTGGVYSDSILKTGWQSGLSSEIKNLLFGKIRQEKCNKKSRETEISQLLTKSTGIEPATTGSTVRDSNQLSYDSNHISNMQIFYPQKPIQQGGDTFLFILFFHPSFCFSLSPQPASFTLDLTMSRLLPVFLPSPFEKQRTPAWSGNQVFVRKDRKSGIKST